MESDRKLGIATMRHEGKEKSMDSVIHVLNCEGSEKLRYLREMIRERLPDGHILKESGPHEKWAQFVVNPASNKLGDMRISVRKIRGKREEKKKEERKRKDREKRKIERETGTGEGKKQKNKERLTEGQKR